MTALGICAVRGILVAYYALTFGALIGYLAFFVAAHVGILLGSLEFLGCNVLRILAADKYIIHPLLHVSALRLLVSTEKHAVLFVCAPGAFVYIGGVFECAYAVKLAVGKEALVGRVFLVYVYTVAVGLAKIALAYVYGAVVIVKSTSAMRLIIDYVADVNIIFGM